MDKLPISDEPVESLLSRVRMFINLLDKYVEHLDNNNDTLFNDLAEKSTFFDIILCDFEEVTNRLERREIEQ